MLWKLIAVAAGVALREVASRSAWRRGYQSGVDAASAWWRAEILLMVQRGELEWGESPESESGDYGSIPAHGPSSEWLN